MGEKVHVGLVYGGRSSEHDLSVQTAWEIFRAMDRDKYNIYLYYLAQCGRWYSAPADSEPPSTWQALQLTDAALLKEHPDDIQPAEADVIVPLLAGHSYEEATHHLPGLAQLPYVGAGDFASAIGMDKIAMKKLFAQEELPQRIYRYFNRTQWLKDPGFFIMEIEISLGYPCVVMSTGLGTKSRPITVRTRHQLIAAVEHVLRDDRRVIVEEAVVTADIEVHVLGYGDPPVYAPVRMALSRTDSAYANSGLPAAEPPEETGQTMRELAVRAAQAVEGAGLLSVLMQWNPADGRLFIDEITALPGYPPLSLYRSLCDAAGCSNGATWNALIEQALERQLARQDNDGVA